MHWKLYTALLVVAVAGIYLLTWYLDERERRRQAEKDAKARQELYRRIRPK